MLLIDKCRLPATCSKGTDVRAIVSQIRTWLLAGMERLWSQPDGTRIVTANDDHTAHLVHQGRVAPAVPCDTVIDRVAIHASHNTRNENGWAQSNDCC